MRFLIGLLCVLVVYWAALSWHFTPLVMTLGAISVGLVIFMVHRMKLFDAETVPYFNLPQVIPYFGWLGKEIASANVAVVKTVLDPDMKISPKMVLVPAEQKTDLGRMVFANSITLTPGTVTVDMQDDGDILVHALLSEMADPAGFKDMGERSAKSVED